MASDALFDAGDALLRPEPLREAVYARVAALINSGSLAPGARITEASVSRSLRVSRTPVREALLRLHSEGVLDSTLAKGFTVRALTIEEARELFPILWNLEALAVRSTNHIDAKRIAQLKKVAEKRENETEPIKRWEMDNEFHSLLVMGCGNESLLGLIIQLRTNLSRYELTYVLNTESRNISDGHHDEILKLMEESNFEGAASLLSEHWRHGMERVIQLLEERETKA